MNIPDVKSAQATATFNRSILKEQFKYQLEKKIEEEIVKEIGVGGYSISLDGSSIDSFRPDYSIEAIEEIKKELRIKGYKVEQVKDIYGIPYYSRLRIDWK